MARRFNGNQPIDGASERIGEKRWEWCYDTDGSNGEEFITTSSVVDS